MGGEKTIGSNKSRNVQKVIEKFFILRYIGYICKINQIKI